MERRPVSPCLPHFPPLFFYISKKLFFFKIIRGWVGINKLKSCHSIRIDFKASGLGYEHYRYMAKGSGYYSSFVSLCPKGQWGTDNDALIWSMEGRCLPFAGCPALIPHLYSNQFPLGKLFLHTAKFWVWWDCVPQSFSVLVLRWWNLYKVKPTERYR